MATVSRVMTGSQPVSADRRARVLRAVDDLDYVVNSHARSLSGTAIEMVAIVLEDITGPSFAAVARGVEQEAAARGRLSLICATHGDPEQELRMVDLMHRQHAAAVILVGAAQDSEYYRVRTARYARSLDSVGSRLVLCGRPPLEEGIPATVVEYDNENGAFAAVSHLLSAGHRKILALPGAEHYSTAEGRLAGYRRALEAHGVGFDPKLVIRGDYTRASGEQAARRLLAEHPEVTAVFAGSDEVALGLMDVAREAGTSLPDRLSIVGYDDVPAAGAVFPKLTTVHVPYEQMGRTAVRLALERFGAGAEDRVVLGTHLKVRASVAAPHAL
ncbi:LacI family DNA-binding transcriptional regulator [Actinospica sp. MGRD01-02]|uniref:LacI family DNA-binding transcriptional regulator n=2 Tax=Actinospica acidithermotolerans TaxID=2828514 RepID=A0A941EDX5_9ACTN|nr:LacI family DNA-binding transcriptional regulator [Actinospica acidithermotolerans]